jgi:hypothetical protein
MCGGCVEEGGADSDQGNHNKEKVKGEFGQAGWEWEWDWGKKREI